MIIIGEITSLLNIIPVILGIVLYHKFDTSFSKIILASLFVELIFEFKALYLCSEGKFNLHIYSLISLQFVLLAGIINYLNNARIPMIFSIIIFVAGVVDVGLNYHALPSYRPVIALSLLGISCLLQIDRITRDTIDFMKDFDIWIYTAYVFYSFSSLTNYIFSKYFTEGSHLVIANYVTIFNFITSLVFISLTSRAFLCLRKI